MAATTIITDLGDMIHFDSLDMTRQVEKIPAKVYRIRVNPETNKIYLITDREKYSIPKIRFGKHDEHKKMIMTSFLECETTMGALFNGLKGSGKTMLAEDVCNGVLELGFPVLYIDWPAPAEVIRKMATVCGPCAVLFDEYGKYYKEEERGMMLTLFSNTDFKKTIWMVCSNSQMELNDFMIDRPSRFRYRINFNGVSSEVVTEMIEGLKLEPIIIEYLGEYCKVHSISFDVMNTLIRPALDSRTIKEFNEKISVLNVPQAIYANIGIIGKIMYNGEKWNGDYTIDEIDGVVKVALYKESEPEPEYKCEVVWLTAKKVALSNGYFNLALDDALTVKVSRYFTPYTMGENIRRPTGRRSRAIHDDDDSGEDTLEPRRSPNAFKHRRGGE